MKRRGSPPTLLQVKAQMPAKAARRRHDERFTTHILPAETAAKLLSPQDKALLRPNDLVFFLYQRRPASGKAAQLDAPAGFCLIREAASEDSAANSGKNFLEIALFRLFGRKPAARAKTHLLRAVADYCRQREISYIFGQFSFSGKYPAAYAQEFSCLYHYYRIKKSGRPPAPLAPKHHQAAQRTSMDIMPAEAAAPDKTHRLYPPLLRYCLRLGAKTDGNVAIDRNYDCGAGAMNVFLWLSAKPALAASAEQKERSAAPP